MIFQCWSGNFLGALTDHSAAPSLSNYLFPQLTGWPERAGPVLPWALRTWCLHMVVPVCSRSLVHDVWMLNEAMSLSLGAVSSPGGEGALVITSSIFIGWVPPHACPTYGPAPSWFASHFSLQPFAFWGLIGLLICFLKVVVPHFYISEICNIFLKIDFIF